MRDKNSDKGFQPIGKAIRELLNSYRIDGKYDETNVINSWERLVGKPIAKRTRKVFIRNKILYAEFDSPSIRQDFSFHKAQVLTLFQKEFGQESIKDIVIL
jgi:predicted nucleic acid-binding Zn ribbon protein